MQSPRSEVELMNNAASLAGETLSYVAEQCDIPIPPNLTRAKGWVGELLERVLGATAQTRPVPDFEALGIELKTLPLNAKHEPQESTFVTTAPMSNSTGLTWDNSPVKAKLNRVLWVPVEASREIPLATRRIGRAFLWSPVAADAEILRNDWEEHMECITLGQLDEIDARRGTYLQIRPKALDSHRRIAAFDAGGNRVGVLPRGFYLRTVFTRKILANL